MLLRDKAIRALAEALPGHTSAIEREYSRSGYFRSICADFCACYRALSYWEKTTSEEGLARSEEYRQLLRELEKEVLGWLEAREALPGPKREGATD